ncbi:RNA polymerase sigma factor (sigma-70 family) [Microbacterium foliorum]|uniref:RNA polymerase sigma factor (Sigma-70 family) n=1 Tax=Microbacterium foliorum TaxID=104336 RepID=A0ABU1HT62_9MICO|nr:sigma-70 family RNA polymerase sigma factor [Microbacterium foliorum]MDR6143226.1 RNA polymerase sigma factor (sigma-70 family) [Microbacterium foliorum]
MSLTADPSTDTRSDAELADATRNGDAQAFAVLWQRHAEAGLRAARAVTRSIDPDDLVSEAFTKTFSAMQNGGGPTDGFRAYLYAAIRNAAATWGGKQKDIPIEFIEEIPDEAPDAIEQLSDRAMLAAAFKNLPENHRTLLWYLEVEGMKPREIAPLMGLTPNAVSALALRARDGFRHAWLDALIADPSRPEECRWACGRLVRRTRRPVSRHERPRLETHLEGCAGCTIIARDIDTASSKLRAVLLPLALGSAGAAAFAALEPGAAASAAVVGPSAVLRSRRVLTLGVAAGSAVALAATVAVAIAAPWTQPAPGTDRSEASGPVAHPVDPIPGTPSATPVGTSPTPPPVPPLVPAPMEPPPEPVLETTPLTSTDRAVPETKSPPPPAPPAVDSPAATPPAQTPPAQTPPAQKPQVETPPPQKPPVEIPYAFSLEPAGWDTSNPLAVSAHGTGIPGSTVAMLDELGAVLAEVPVDDEGVFEISVAGDDLRQGMTLTAQHTSPTGDVDLSEPLGPLAFPVPVISGGPSRIHLDGADADADGERDDALVSLEGIPGGWVQVAVDGVVNPHLIAIDEVTSDDYIPDIHLGFHLLTLRYVDVESGLIGPGAEYAVVVTPG